MKEAEIKSPVKVQKALESGIAAAEELKSLQSEKEKLTAKADDHLQTLQPLAGRLSSLYSQIAEVERFKAYVNWINKVENIR